jgi:lipopolysaccharide assembly outer membrane protein LptD (OstA)
LHTNLFNIVLLAYFLTIGFNKIHSQELNINTTSIPVNQSFDSLKVYNTQNKILTDTIKKDSIKPKKEFLNSKVKYKAEKYTRINQKEKTITLYDNAELYYEDIVLKSGIIVFNYELDEVYAGRIKDSAGNFIQLPRFKQLGNEVEPDSIRFNYKTKKALVWNSRTEQGEFRVKAEVVKRQSDSVYFMKNARFTTSKNIDNPEYYFKTNKVKFVPGKKVITGLTNMVIADVPTPLALPFAFFPMTEKSQSGIIIPTFNSTQQRGYALQNGGYYFALSDKYDLALLGDYYTNGSYGLRAETNYALRYKFRGRLNVRYENNITSERGYPDYSKESIYNIQWNHSQDPKSSPNSRFSSSVNIGSSQYFKQSINQINAGSSLNNTMNSSINYSKTFQTVPQVQTSISATHQQNTNTGVVSMTLPSLVVTMDGVYPFSPKGTTRKGFIKNINILYNGAGDNKINTVDTLLFKSGMFENATMGYQHRIPLSTNFKLFKYFSTSTAVNYQEVWVFKTIRKFYDPINQKDTTVTVNGFDSFRTGNFSAGMGTTIYGTFKFGDNKKIQAIRHVMRPSVSYSYTPSYQNYYENYESNDGALKNYTRFEGSLYGVPSLSDANSIGMGLSNTFEAKVKDKESEKGEAKKVMLLNNFNLSTSYNIIADSLKWSPLRITGGTLLFKNKMNVNFGMTLNPYALDNANRIISEFNIDNGGSLFRMTSADLNFSYSIASSEFKEKKNIQGMQNGGREDDLFGTNTDFTNRSDSQFRENEEGEDTFLGFYKYNLPWDLTMSYQLTYSNVRRENEITGNSLMFSVNSQLTPKWKGGISSGYDFLNKGITFTQLRFERDLLSWRMDFNWVPLGPNAYWSFFIGIKSGVLSDIQWEKHSQPN